MSKFEANRFLTYAKWDITINKSFYLNFAMIAFLAVIILSLSSANQYFNILGMGELAAYTIIEGLSWSFSEWVILIFFGFFLHNMITRKSRIYELSVPASNLEKFTWHIVCCLAGGALFSLAGTIVFDIIQAIWVGSSIGFDKIHSVTIGLFSYDTKDILNLQFVGSELSVQGANSQAATNLTKEILCLFQDFSDITRIHNLTALFLQTSLMALVNSFKYKNNIPWSLLIFFSFGILIVIIITALAISYGPAILSNSQSHDNFMTLLSKLHLKDIVKICLAIQFAIGTAFWFWTYRNYTHSQIITKRKQQ